MTPLHDQPLHRILDGFVAGVLKPSVYMEHLLARIACHEPALNAFIARDETRARAAADDADEAYARGAPRPLEGIPVAIKDVIDVEGFATTCHSKLRLDHRPDRDAASVAALRRAGAIILGKTATHEFAIGGPAFDLPFPPARNPWNRMLHPGGSSSGSACGVAAGFVPAAIGTDTGGSVRHPASACGLVGLKPTYDAISREGVFPLAFSLDHVGVIARTVDDAARLCDCMSDGTTSARRDLGQPVEGLRIGYVRHFHETDMPAVAEIAAGLDAAAARLEAAGAIVANVRLPGLQSFASCNRIILQSEAIAIHGTWMRERPEDYCGISRRNILPGVFLSAEDLVQAQRRRRELILRVEEAFETCDVLLTASSMEFPCRIDDGAEVERTYGRQARTPFNVTGHPAITLPCGIAQGGLPLSLQLAGKAGDEATLCRTAAAIELPFVAPPLA